MKKFQFNDEIKKILFFGGNIHMMNAISILQKHFKNINFEVLLSKRHLNHYINENLNLKEYLEKENIKYYVISKFDDFFHNFNFSGVYGMSFGSPWIFKKAIIEKFDGKLLNFHNDILPNFRGAASVSWRILMGVRIGSCTCHIIDEGIDSGDILYQEVFVYEQECRLPVEYELFLTNKFKTFFYNLINSIETRTFFDLQSQQDIFEEYWPRLNTDINGYIDWNMKANEIDRFICAFDEPYKGASTFLNGQRCFLKNVILDFLKTSFHSFQYGLVYKKTSLGVFVAINGATLIVRKVLDEKQNSLLDNIKIGDRFYTPYEYINNSKSERIYYDLNGLKK